MTSIIAEYIFKISYGVLGKLTQKYNLSIFMLYIFSKTKKIQKEVYLSLVAPLHNRIIPDMTKSTQDSPEHHLVYLHSQSTLQFHLMLL